MTVQCIHEEMEEVNKKGGYPCRVREEEWQQKKKLFGGRSHELTNGPTDVGQRKHGTRRLTDDDDNNALIVAWV